MKITTQQELQSFLHYSPETGIFTWTARTPNKAGTRAGCLNAKGNRVILLRGYDYREHILAFLYVWGHLPARKLRHLDGDLTNSRIANLEEIPKPPKKTHPALTCERLRELLDYDPSTGVFVWVLDRGGKARAGDPAGSISDQGYFCIEVDGKSYKAHRLAWLYVHGKWPKNKVDHRDEVKTNNRIDNLRDVTDSISSQNRTTGWGASTYLGVHSVRGGWRACIKVDGRSINLGTFPDEKAASDAYRSAKKQYHQGWVEKPVPEEPYAPV